MEPQERLGQRIRSAREQKGWTQADLGRALSLQQSSVSDIEKGVTKVGVFDLLRIAEALGRHPAYFVPEVAGPAATDEEELLALYRSLPTTEAQRALLGSVRVFAQSMGDG